jgi:hypothetical protein
MILFDDKKRMATILARRKNTSGEPMGAAQIKPEVVKTEDGEIDGRHVAMKDLMVAMHEEKSPHKAMQALANFIDLHHQHREMNPPEEIKSPEHSEE